MPKLIHLRADCIGCHSCVEHAPAYWFMDTDGKATLREAVEKKGAWIRPLEEAFASENETAAADCPVDIIKIQG